MTDNKSLILLAREILTEALLDDHYKDHSSGCWQKKAKDFRNITRKLKRMYDRQ